MFEQLGYSNGQSKRFGFVYTQNGEIGCDSMEHWDYYNDLCQELTLPKLRDLVVLKRNDVKDANCIDKKREAWYLASDGTYYAWQYRKLCWDTESDACVEAHDIKPINQPQDPALISGDVALANVHKCTVQYLHDDEPYGRWTTITDNLWSQYHLGMFLDPDTKFKFRFKPQTIKLELELPKPFEPEEDCHVYILDDGKTDGYRRYSYEVHGDKGNTFIGIWRTEDEIKQVVEQLRKIRGAS
ncbi:hypothetical protein [Acinetobacter baumannii]|uniref:hypothetical protein n=1 Tax=Acinetobacter baumannii TaxID=470 RepID=UPI00215FD604|nr:hypothetical protein [Acinetobacter baumannii]